METTVRHVLFWIVIYILWTYMKASRVHYSVYLIVNLVNVAIYIGAYYYLKKVQIPKFFSQEKYFIFAISILASSFFFYLIWRINGELWIDQLRRINYQYFMTPVDYMTQAVQFYSPAMALLAWDSFYERKREQERISLLEKEKLQNELKFLKAQLNPHFLFNTLNNLYSFVVQGSPHAPDMIMRLSSILDYVLYKSQKNRVLLRDEIQAIQDFIDLEKTRYGNRLIVTFENSGSMDAQVSPLLFLSIVENAFKHGASGDIDTPEIHIGIHEDNGEMQCRVWNTKSAIVGELNDAYKEGIGLSNIKRQLDLIYHNHHDLKVEETENCFSIQVTINPNRAEN